MLAERTGFLTESFRDYCIRVIRFVSDSALDPHLYFEKKFTGDVSVASSDAELASILGHLAAWFDETEPDKKRLARFDEQLLAAGLPSLSVLLNSATRDAGIAMCARPLHSASERVLILEAINISQLSPEDSRLAQQIIAEY
ncbi:MAG: hypothetical protein OEU86_00930, partial [Gammaproteobacteria bacterium]|nr:hypothetical protein [Gammaproteobacteria bacterium]